MPKGNETLLLIQHACIDFSFSRCLSHVFLSRESGGPSVAFGHLGAGG